MAVPENNDWLKNRGYLHITPKINIFERGNEIKSKVENEDFVAKHAFFPLIHSNIKERRYKKIDLEESPRAHSFIDKNGIFKRSTKYRPLHYATHIDAQIFSYYSRILEEQYEKEVNKTIGLSSSIIAYRKLEHESGFRNKNNIDFAFEVFKEIKNKSDKEASVVLKFDIESFFSSLNHNILKKAWYKLVAEKEKSLPKHHYNVFKAVTKFSYILLDDLRVTQRSQGRRAGFDEKRLAELRKKGIQAFFESPEEFRKKINSKEIKVFKNPFFDRNIKKPKGIPQGLPISAVLANLYLLEFDQLVYNKVVKENYGFYRRYSDDIIIICKPENYIELEKFIVDTIEQVKLQIAKDKTETFFFRKENTRNDVERLISIKLKEKGECPGIPFSYLGFEFYGHKTLVKSSNLAKFYRRMKVAVKRKANRLTGISEKTLVKSPPIYKRQLYKFYSFHGKNRRLIFPLCKAYKRNYLGEFRIQKQERKKPLKYRGNYISYIHRASEEMKEYGIRKQIRNHFRILRKAMDDRFKQSLVSS